MEKGKVREGDFEEVITARDIGQRVIDMGQRITQDYAGETLTVIGALKGCFMFMADLVRAIDLPLHVDFIEVSSYGDSTESSGVVKITKDFKHSIENEHVLLVEDIIDTGLTLNYLMEIFELRNPKSLKIAALLVKEEKQKLKYPISYRGFNIDDDFVVGYGMDYKGFCRNIGSIHRLRDK